MQRRALIAGFALLLLTVPTAQNPRATYFSATPTRNADLNNGNRSNMNGWEGSLEGKALPFVGIVADFSGH